MLTTNKILGLNSIQWVPDGSDNKTPMLCALFFPGAGEIGTDPSKLSLYGPGAFLKAASQLGYNIRAISVQNVNPNPRPSETGMVMDAIAAIYNTPKFVPMGLSRGGQDWDWYVSNAAGNLSRIAGMLIASSQGPVGDVPGIPGTWTPQWFVDNKVSYAFAIGTQDPFYDANKARYNALVKAGATATWEEFPGAGHDGSVWTKVFDPFYKQSALGGMTWPQWMNGLSAPAATSYTNVEAKLGISKNDCTMGTGSTELYIVPAGKYSSTISQADADAQAQADITHNAQGYANSVGTCSAKLIATVQIFSDGTTKTIPA